MKNEGLLCPKQSAEVLKKCMRQQWPQSPVYFQQGLLISDLKNKPTKEKKLSFIIETRKMNCIAFDAHYFSLWHFSILLMYENPGILLSHCMFIMFSPYSQTEHFSSFEL